MAKKLESSLAAAPTAAELAAYDYNDLGNAKRLIRLAGGAWPDPDGDPDVSNVQLLYLKGYGWVGYNGKYWDRECGEEIARKLAHQVATHLRAAVNEMVKQSSKPDGKIQEFVERCGNAGATSAMLKQAESYLTVAIDIFDQHPAAFNCNNGTLWLVDGKGLFKPKLRSHSPSDRITRFIDFDYDEKAECPEFKKALTDALPEDDKREFFHRAMGYGATGFVYEQAFFLYQGLGRDGKSTLLNATRQTLGTYAGVGDVKTFLDIGQQGASNASPDLAKLAGDVRFVVLSEPPRDAKLNESLLKNWTGGDPIQARELREKPFDFSPLGKLNIQCNAFPVAKGNDEGIWRRMFPVLFENQVPIELVDRKLPERIKANERPGVLNWIIAGVGDWLEQGLAPPECVTRARDEYRAQSSPFIDWLNERCVHGKAAGDATTSAKELHDDFKIWSEAQGQEKIMTMTGFGRALAERQIRKQKRNGNIYRTPIRLKKPDELLAANSFVTPPDKGGLSFGGASATSSSEDRFSGESPFDDPDTKW